MKTNVQVELHEIIDYNLEGFLDLISERACKSPLLMDISYRVVGHDGDTLTIEVTSDDSMVNE